MALTIEEILAAEFNIRPAQAQAAVKLMDDGNTIPFIARYRKEMTGSLDDTVLRGLAERLEYLRSLQKRREEVIALIDAQGALTDDITQAVSKAATLAEIEDIYRPYRPKRKTRASVAREKGLDELAQWLMQQNPFAKIGSEAEKYVSEEKGVESAEDALSGARDILAETFSDDAALRGLLRNLLWRTANINSKGLTEEKTVYSGYYEYSEPVNRAASHRILALDRGEREEVLKVWITADDAKCTDLLRARLVKNKGEAAAQVDMAVQDSWQRLIYPSMERELRNELTQKAAEQAIGVFSENLRNLLMQAPVKGAVTLGLDPAYRTGCKIAVVDHTGKVLDTTVIYPTPPHNKTEQSAKILKELINKHNVSVIAIGNGTASRESEQFVADTIKDMDGKVSYMVVSEAGASVYSASKLAAEEFPQFDVALRSAVSIARRLQDPLAELVKIDPKAIGVGQYQHDMPKARLDEALGGVVEGCVNTVGVDLNTASHSLLSYVAGINSGVAKNIVAYREEEGAFTNRKQLLKVPKLGKKAFEQCAGFLRISDGENYLDSTAVHPESYAAAQKLIKLCGYSIDDKGFDGIKEKAQQLGWENIAEQTGVGEITLKDIAEELLKPGRDPRDELEKPLLRTDVLKMEDLKAGMQLEGTVRNVIDFGAFVDIGVHEDGLVHISQMAEKFVKHPSQVVKVGDIVTVWVLDVDVKRSRISLTMRKPAN
ncbi:MAG: RNA-binding transcriptional accessory protein [Oscillospiraceae bacterium]|nr:RNA-binding transcriptional accessory protein [Oscillospiraceae bacterium]